MENANLRQTAYKLWISDLLNGVFIKGQQEYESSYVATRGLNVSRVNLMGVVISLNSTEGFASLVLDDGSGAITARVWKDDVSKLNNIFVGSLVLVVAKVKSFNNVVYLVPDFVSLINDPLWIKFRKIELEKKFGKNVKLDNVISNVPSVDEYIPNSDLEEQDLNFMAVQEEKVSNDNPIALVNSLIQDEDKGEGADIALVIAKSGLNEDIAQRVIDELIRGGEVFEIRPGFIRTLA